MGTLALSVDETAAIEALGSRQEPAIEIGDPGGRWAVRFVGSYDDLQRLFGEGLRLLYKLPSHPERDSMRPYRDAGLVR